MYVGDYYILHKIYIVSLGFCKLLARLHKDFTNFVRSTKVARSITEHFATCDQYLNC
jgi:hypothetical protein